MKMKHFQVIIFKYRSNKKYDCEWKWLWYVQSVIMEHLGTVRGTDDMKVNRTEKKPFSHDLRFNVRKEVIDETNTNRVW